MNSPFIIDLKFFKEVDRFKKYTEPKKVSKKQKE